MDGELESTDYQEPEKGRGECDEERHSRAWIKAAVVVLVVVLAIAGGYGATAYFRGTYEIPENYKLQIKDLRDKNIENCKKVQEFQRQIAVLNAETAFNASRMDILAQEAINSLSLGEGNYRVNLTTLKIEKIPK